MMHAWLCSEPARRHLLEGIDFWDGVRVWLEGISYSFFPGTGDFAMIGALNS
ncbi:MAG: hypothetical protein VX815_04900 [Gemmatimonadota bacterium]|nr:hypothetical protein [Gemmatimonadota bacterium]